VRLPGLSLAGLRRCDHLELAGHLAGVLRALDLGLLFPAACHARLARFLVLTMARPAGAPCVPAAGLPAAGGLELGDDLLECLFDVLVPGTGLDDLDRKSVV